MDRVVAIIYYIQYIKKSRVIDIIQKYKITNNMIK